MSNVAVGLKIGVGTPVSGVGSNAVLFVDSTGKISTDGTFTYASGYLSVNNIGVSSNATIYGICEVFGDITCNADIYGLNNITGKSLRVGFGPNPGLEPIEFGQTSYGHLFIRQFVLDYSNDDILEDYVGDGYVTMQWGAHYGGTKPIWSLGMVDSGVASRFSLTMQSDLGFTGSGSNDFNFQIACAGSNAAIFEGWNCHSFWFSTGGSFMGFAPARTERMRLTNVGKLGIGVSVPTAYLHLKAGSTSANSAPQKFSSGSLMTTAEAGAVEFLTDDYYLTITTGAARKKIALVDSTLTTGQVVTTTTNGRLVSSATLGIANGGTNASSFGTTNGVTYYNGTSLVNDSAMTYASSRLTNTNHTVSGSLIIPNGTSPTLANAGELALDTTNDQLCIYNGSAKVIDLPKKSLSFVLDTPTASDVFPIKGLPYAITLTKVTGTCYGGTSVTFQIDKRAAASLNSAGTNMLTSSLTATTTGANTTSFSAAGAASGYFLTFVASAVSGTVGKLVIDIEFTIDRT